MIPSRVSIAIVDDHPMARAGLRTILSEIDFVDVVADGENGKQALAIVREFNPDILLMDIEMPRMNGVQVTKQLRAELSTVKVIAISGYDAREYVYGVLASGASAFVMKEEATAPVLRNVITSVMQDEELWISPTLAHKLVQAHIVQLEVATVLEDLTERELEILKLVAHGRSNDDIAEQLHIAAVTVRNHANHLRTKLDVHTRAELAVWAWEHGIVSVDDGVVARRDG